MDAIDEIFFKNIGNLTPVTAEKLRQAKIEHIKRKPEIIKEWTPKWLTAHEHWKTIAQLDAEDPRNRIPPLLISKLTQEEQKIINQK